MALILRMNKKRIEKTIPDSNRTPLTELELPILVLEFLKNSGIDSVEILSSKSVDELINIQGIGNAALFCIDSALREYGYRGLEGGSFAERAHIFNQSFPIIFEQYKNKRGIKEWEKKGLATLEEYLSISDYKGELFSGTLALPDQQTTEVARRFRNNERTQRFARALDSFASGELKLQGVLLHHHNYSDNYSGFWREYRKELKSILDSILEPLSSRGCFGEFNPYKVYMLLFSDCDTTHVRVTFFNSLSHFFRCENELAKKRWGDDSLWEWDTEIDGTE